MKNSKGFTLLEVLIALGIMSIAMVFLINGIHNIDTLFNENQRTVEMGKVLQSNIEMILSQKEELAAHTYHYDDYLVEVFLEPFRNSDLISVTVVIESPTEDRLSAVVLYDP
ncbi:type II secretion system protein [Isachenkonia alkalipeptolytica]|nr:type II secretion system protein [Isachenkonia alkalipeptolytica]